MLALVVILFYLFFFFFGSDFKIWHQEQQQKKNKQVGRHQTKKLCKTKETINRMKSNLLNAETIYK